MKNTLLLLIGLLTSVLSYSQGYEIKVKMDGMSCDDELLLANYYGDKQYLRDTSVCENGLFVFRGNNPLETGIYLVVTPDRKYFEIILSDDEDQTTYYFATDTLLNPELLQTKGSKENEVFAAFNKFAAQKGKEASALNIKIKGTEKEKEKKILQEELAALGKSVNQKRLDFAAMYPELFISKVFMAMQEIKIPEPATELSDSARRVFGYMYIRNHYWDNIDLGEDGMVRTPIFHRKLKDYFDNYIPPIADTSTLLADNLINSMEDQGSMEQFKYTIHFLLSYYQKVKYMCFDKALYHMTNNYYCNGRAYWVDSSFQAEMCEQSQKMGPTLCGLVAPNIVMPDTNFRERKSLHDIDKPVTILVFWDIDCGHCKKEIPILKEFYDSANREEVEIFAVYTQGDWEGWREFVKEKDLGWINVANAFLEDKFRDNYNIISTPQIYVLNKNKEIKFKKLAAKDVAGVVKYLLEQQDSESTP